MLSSIIDGFLKLLLVLGIAMVIIGILYSTKGENPMCPIYPYTCITNQPAKESKVVEEKPKLYTNQPISEKHQ